MGWNIVMLRQACHFALEKKIKQKTSRKFKTQAQVTQKLKEIMGILNLPEFFQNNSRIFWKSLGFFLENSRVFPKTQGFSKYTQGFSPNT